MLYTKETLDIPAKNNFTVIVEFNDNDLAVGIMGFSKYRPGKYCVKNLDTGNYKIPTATHFSRSHVKRLIYLGTGYVLPKDINKKHEMGKNLNILELNELINKAGYEYI